LGSEYVTRLVHELVVMAAAFEDAGFAASGTMADLAGGDLLE
jgi:hypothetical protein